MYSNSPVAKLDDPGSRAVYCKLAGVLVIQKQARFWIQKVPGLCFATA